jgi:hypothetical protein
MTQIIHAEPVKDFFVDYITKDLSPRGLASALTARLPLESTA